MKQQLKIIIDYETKNGENSITTVNTIFYVNDAPIGCIQDLKLHANSHDQHPQYPQLEILFPNLKDTGSSFVHDIDHNIKILSTIPNVKISMQDLVSSETYALHEIGTDGKIDIISKT